MKPFLEARENGLDSSSIKHKLKQSHQIDLAESSCWRSLENLVGIISEKLSGIFEGMPVLGSVCERDVGGRGPQD